MNPGARFAAAIELLDHILSGTAAADRLIASYFRQRRYAGSKDRHSVAELVYAALRQYGTIAWRLRQAGSESSPRLTVFAASGLPVEAIESALGGRYAPDPLSESERVALAAPPPADMPDWARANVPEWLAPSLRVRFGATFLAELQALAGRAPLDLRTNTLKADRKSVQQKLEREGIRVAPTPFSPLGLRLPDMPRLERHPLYLDGCVEPQDEAAQLASLLVGASPGLHVLDYCAGGGGKTLALAASMGNQGELVATDRDSRRLDRIRPRAVRAGVANLSIRPIADIGRAGETFDRVLLDVPCSGTGTWRRNPEARWRLTPDMLARQFAEQRDLLDRAAPLVRPGGRLIYVTCSLLPEENEQQMHAFLDRLRDFQPLPVGQLWAESIGGACPAEGDFLSLTPLRHGTDGFFTSALQRQTL